MEERFLTESFINQKQLTMLKNKKIINLCTNKKIEREFRILELIRRIEKSIKEFEKEIKELSNKLLRPFDENFCT
jgi:hypothetical protein